MNPRNQFAARGPRWIHPNESKLPERSCCKDWNSCLGLGMGRTQKPFPRVGVSIGDHYGQGIQHFRSLIQGYHGGEIRYAGGKPDGRLRTDVVYASIATCDVLRDLKRYPPESFARECLVVGGQRENRGGLSDFTSTLSNELAYCTATAMRQYAAIRGICEHLELAPLRDFGRANGDGLSASNSKSES